MCGISVLQHFIRVCQNLSCTSVRMIFLNISSERTTKNLLYTYLLINELQHNLFLCFATINHDNHEAR